MALSNGGHEHRRARSHRFVPVGLLLLLLVISGCGSSEPAASEPAASEPAASEPAASEPATEDQLAEWVAAAEGSVTFYGSITPEQHEQIIAAFNEVYPNIRVDNLRISTGELGQRVAAEAEIGQVTADVVSLSDPVWWADAASQGWFAAVTDLPALENISEQFEADTYVTFYLTPYVLSYNTDLVAEEDVPQTLEDLLDPRWRGLTLMIEPTGSPSQTAWNHLVSEVEGMEFLRQLAANDLVFVETGVVGVQQVGAGAAALLLPTAASNVYSQISAGAPINYTFLPPATGTLGAFGISLDAPHPNAARVFANFLLTEPAQEIMGKTGTPVLPGVEGPFPISDDFEPLDVEAGRANRDATLEALGVQQ